MFRRIAAGTGGGRDVRERLLRRRRNNAPPAQPPAGQPAQQAQTARTSAMFANDGGMVLNFIKPDKTADFEAIDGEAEGSAAEERQAGTQAAGSELEGLQVARSGAGGNVLYVFIIDRRR